MRQGRIGSLLFATVALAGLVISACNENPTSGSSRHGDSVAAVPPQDASSSQTAPPAASASATQPAAADSARMALVGRISLLFKWKQAESADRLLAGYIAEHPEEELGVLVDLSEQLLLLGEVARAYEIARQAVERLRSAEHVDDAARAGAHAAVADAAMSMGDFEEAATAVDEALRIYTAMPEADPRRFARTLTILADLSKKRGQLREALQTALLALDKREAISASVAEIVASEMQVAEVYQGLGVPGNALEHLAAARERLQPARPEYGLLVGQVATLKGLALHRLGRLDEADAELESAAAVFRSVGAWRRAAAAEVLHADVELSGGRGSQAEARIRGVLERVKGDLPPKHPELAKMLAILGEAQRVQGKWAEAIATLEEARDIALNYSLRRRPALSRARQAKSLDARRILAQLVACYVQQGKSELALETVEYLHGAIASGERPDAGGGAEIRDALTEGEAFASLQISYGVATFLVISRQNQEPLAILLTDDQPGTEALLRRLRALACAVRDRRLPMPDCQALGEDLCPPRMREALKDVRRLIVAADDHLAAIPLDLLLPVPQVTYVPSGTELVERQAGGIPRQHAPQGRLVIICAPDYGAWSLYCADPGLPPKLRGSVEKDVKLRPLSGAGQECEDLELLAARAGLRTDVLTGPRANVSEVERLAAAADIIHVAAHSVPGSRGFEDEARVCLGPDPNLPAPEQRLLDLSIIERWDTRLGNRHPLVVLAACESAADVQVAVAPFSLSTSFFRAGCRAVVASRWPVDDQSAGQLMGRFYQDVFGLFDDARADYRPGERMTYGDALAEARAWMRRQSPPRPAERWPGEMSASEVDYAHPYYWAGFVLVGQPNEYE